MSVTWGAHPTHEPTSDWGKPVVELDELGMASLVITSAAMAKEQERRRDDYARELKELDAFLALPKVDEERARRQQHTAAETRTYTNQCLVAVKAQLGNWELEKQHLARVAKVAAAEAAARSANAADDLDKALNQPGMRDRLLAVIRGEPRKE